MDALGINVYNLLIYIALFIVVFILLSKFLFPALSKSIDERIQLLENNKKMKAKLESDEKSMQENIKTQETEVLKEAKAQASQIISAAETEAMDIQKKAKVKADRVLEEAKSAVKIQEEKLKEQYEKDVRTMAVRIVKEVYSEDLDAEKVSSVFKKINL